MVIAVILLALFHPCYAQEKDTIPDTSPTWSDSQTYYDYLVDQLKYPAEAISLRYTGSVYVDFKVDSLGNVFNAKVDSAEQLGYGFDKAAIEFIMSTSGKWKPGTHSGKPASAWKGASVDFSMIIWKLEKEGVVKPASTFTTTDGSFYRSKATFLGGASTMNNFIRTNMEYPEEALAKNIEGRVLVSFVVERDGRVSSVRLITDQRLGSGCDEEAVRVIKLMSGHWQPAYQRGVPVRMRFTLPIRFVPLTAREIKKKDKSRNKESPKTGKN
jgi:TonB family protein